MGCNISENEFEYEKSLNTLAYISIYIDKCMHAILNRRHFCLFGCRISQLFDENCLNLK